MSADLHTSVSLRHLLLSLLRRLLLWSLLPPLVGNFLVILPLVQFDSPPKVTLYTVSSSININDVFTVVPIVGPITRVEISLYQVVEVNQQRRRVCAIVDDCILGRKVASEAISYTPVSGTAPQACLHELKWGIPVDG